MNKRDVLKDKKFSFLDSEPVVIPAPSLRPSFGEAISRAEVQVGYSEYFGRGNQVGDQMERQLVHEICAIIAEVYMMDPARQIRISGEWLDVYVVQEVFGQITYEHVMQVLGDFSRLCCDIKNKKAYLRAMLYNSVFTLQASIVADSIIKI
jgi:hypothetical protein